MIVVDLGCAPHGPEQSIGQLIDRFQPDTLYGFDPWPGLVDSDSYLFGTRVEIRRSAAWTHDGFCEYAHVNRERSWDSTIVRAKNSRNEWAGDVIEVPCFDFAVWLRHLRHAGAGFERVVVKMDIEGAEFALLSYLHEDGSDSLIDWLLVEWHDQKMEQPRHYLQARRRLLRDLRCSVAAW